MEIEPISEIGSVAASSAFAAEYSHLSHASPSEVALAQAQAKEQETTEQLAKDGDPLAQVQLTNEEQRLIPIDEQHILPANLAHEPGAHEAGKGDLIDIYD